MKSDFLSAECYSATAVSGSLRNGLEPEEYAVIEGKWFFKAGRKYSWLERLPSHTQAAGSNPLARTCFLVKQLLLSRVASQSLASNGLAHDQA